MSSYADIGDIKPTLSIAGADTFADNDIERAISAASQGLDKELGRVFGQSEDENDVRLYSPDIAYRTGELEIDDLTEFTQLRVSLLGDGTWETWTLDTDFRLEPLNADVLGGPFTLVRSLRTKVFPSDPLGLVEVTGKFGWPDVPAAIVEATGLIAEQLLVRKRQAPLGVLTVGTDVGAVAYIARNDPQVAGLISGFYRRSRVNALQLS